MLFDPSGEAVLWLDGDCQTILSQRLLQPPLEIEGGSFRRDRRYLLMDLHGSGGSVGMGSTVGGGGGGGGRF